MSRILYSALILLLLLPDAGASVLRDFPVSRLCAQDLDREFYNDYLDSLPDERVLRKNTLEENLLRVLKRIIPREDPESGNPFVRTLKKGDFHYQRVTEESAFIRGLFQELPYLKPTEFMWVVKTGPYMLFVTFRFDPRRYLISEQQTRLVIKMKQKPGGHPD